MNSEESNGDESDVEERTQIRSELSSLSFEQLQKLKEEIGAKVYKEAMFGAKEKDKRAREGLFKRENKNRPREMTSKKPVPLVKPLFGGGKVVPRDPRFDRLCGEFDVDGFRSSYSFLGDVREQELGSLRDELKSSADPERQETIKYLIQRMENQNRESERKKNTIAKRREEKEEQIEQLKKGKRPQFVKKSEKRVLDLVEQYKNLKKSGKLEKHIERKRKKSTHQSRKNFNFD